MEIHEITQLLLNAKTNNIAIVDVRTYAEREQIFIPNTLHIPIDDLESKIDDLKGFDKVYFFCKAGVRAGFALQIAQNYKIDSVAINNSIFEIHLASQNI
ncbi:MAG: rhodanese-related sulfurtransferase [Candidatus Deianiraeaceae bacterium]|jgi:rhodanese-related sulfurtransferase